MIELSKEETLKLHKQMWSWNCRTVSRNYRYCKNIWTIYICNEAALVGSSY